MAKLVGFTKHIYKTDDDLLTIIHAVGEVDDGRRFFMGIPTRIDPDDNAAIEELVRFTLEKITAEEIEESIKESIRLYREATGEEP